MEFAEVRPYQAGDDVRSIDWRHTARRGRPYTKVFHEEHEQALLLLVDMGPSMWFGTRVAFKSVVASQAAAMLAWQAHDAGDRVGGIVWTGDSGLELRPARHANAVMALIRQLVVAGERLPTAATGLSGPLQALARAALQRPRVVVISDFHALDAAASDELLRLGQHTRLDLLQIYDPLEAIAPPPGCYRISDGERELTLDLRDEAERHAFIEPLRARGAALGALAKRCGARLASHATHDDPLRSLNRLSCQPRRTGPTGAER